MVDVGPRKAENLFVAIRGASNANGAGFLIAIEISGTYKCLNFPRLTPNPPNLYYHHIVLL